MASISVRVVICAALFSDATNSLPPYPLYVTPRAVPCNKAEFRIHHRHIAGGVSEQRMTTLRNYIDFDAVFVLYVDICTWEVMQHKH